MPYIEQQRRVELGSTSQVENVGELTFLLTNTILNLLPVNNDATHLAFRRLRLKIELDVEIENYLYEDRQGEPRFQDYAEVLAALTATKLEFGRRRADRPDWVLFVDEVIDSFTSRWYAENVAPYEDCKREENGDVYS